ncbi:mycofactocin biosynthesis peptidyl-dipeptidase MftE [Nocardioides panzhihuensis]|uniref:Creatinine amidohydrolase n=1 Tax=Nocardioides panzhihuensis TaxID=860243 RepID=A0A7Z0IRF7_9ACTN|nr:creatinine amidohydrolase [Nocardioides panzhihuensis]
MSLVDRPSPEIVPGGTVLVPVGSTEQHGPHLPLDVDTVIATAVADELAPLIGASVAPAVPIGASGEHQSFPGTISIGTAVLTSVLVELGRSLTTWAARVVLVNGHGGNLDAVTAAVTVLRAEGRKVAWVPCQVPYADPHAGLTETSLMLHLDPERVRLRQAVAGNTRPLRELLSQMCAGGVEAVSANGVLGDPTGASAEIGKRILAEMVFAAYDRLQIGVVAR